MAKLSKKKLTAVKEAILHDGSCFEREAFNFGVTKENLMEQMESMYEGGRKNTQYKAVLNNSNQNASRIPEEELKKMVVRERRRAKAKAPAAPKSNSQVATNALAVTNALTVTNVNVQEVDSQAVLKTHAVADENVSETAVSKTRCEAEEENSSEMIDALLLKKESLENQLITATDDEKSAKEVVRLREQTFEMAKEVYEKARQALSNAENELKSAYEEETLIKSEVSDVRAALEKVEEMLERAKSKVYLVSPWYANELPKYGTFISTVEKENCVKQDVPEEYLPEMTVNGILLFEYVPDYKKAREFVGLVAMYELEGKAYSILADDPRVKSLIEATI